MIFIWLMFIEEIFVRENIVSALQLADSGDGPDITHSRVSRNADGVPYYIYNAATYPRDCTEVYDKCDDKTSGVFLIQPDGAEEPFQVYCNNSIDGGKWTVFQRRSDGSVDFYRDWQDYENGFGLLNQDFWLGNDKISLLTNQKDYELRIDMNDYLGTPYYAIYSLFRISDEFSKYRLVSIGDFDSTSTAGRDTLINHLNRSFTTNDRDNDENLSENNAVSCRGAWWYNSQCTNHHSDISNLNGLYFAGSSEQMSIIWDDLGGTSSDKETNLAYAEMKIRPSSIP